MNRVVIDVREPFEYAQGHVSCAINAPLSAISAGAAELDDISKNVEIIVYCHSGGRSNAAMQILASLGFTNVTNCINQAQVCKIYDL